MPGSGKFTFGGTTGAVDVAEVMDGLGWQGVRELVEAGALVSIALTRDGGALSLTVTVDGEWERGYFRSQDELGLWIAQALPEVAAMTGRDRPSAVPGAGSRRRKGH